MNKLHLVVNKKECLIDVESRDLLCDVIRNRLNLHGTHVGCEHGACGACTVHIDGVASRSCLVLAVTCEDQEIRTIEGTHDDPIAAVLRQKFTEHHALQCGYCTPGMVMIAMDILRRHKMPSEATVRHELTDQVCRCTGYHGIVDAILDAARTIQAVPVGEEFTSLSKAPSSSRT